MKTLLPLLMVLAVGVAHAQADFSPKPVRIISPYPPGGAADALARQIAAPLGKRLNQSVVVENRPGAGGTIGANACKSSPPGGFTYCMFLTDIVALNPYTFKPLAYDADRDFIPVAAVASLELVIVGPATGPGTLKEALAFAKANPGKVNWASFGIGTSAHLLLERIKKSAGVDIQHIPYQGGGPAVNEMQETIEGHARGFGLDFFPIIYVVLDYKTMNEVAAYGGFPTRYPHWRFGMDYEQLAKGYEWGLQKIYEMVINTNPAYAYLLDGNSLVDQKIVMAHVCAHVDFFQHNYYFSKTNRKMIDGMANHAALVRRHMERQGQDVVEDFIDTCLSLENLIDPMSAYIQRTAKPKAALPDEIADDGSGQVGIAARPEK